MLIHLSMTCRMKSLDLVASEVFLRVKFCGVAIDDAGNRSGPDRSVRCRRRLVRNEHHICQRFAQFRRDGAADSEMIESLLLVEPRHLDRPFDHLAAAGDLGSARSPAAA